MGVHMSRGRRCAIADIQLIPVPVVVLQQSLTLQHHGLCTALQQLSRRYYRSVSQPHSCALFHQLNSSAQFHPTYLRGGARDAAQQRALAGVGEAHQAHIRQQLHLQHQRSQLTYAVLLWRQVQTLKCRSG